MARKLVSIYFNDEMDAKLIEFVRSHKNFSRWIRDKIREELHEDSPEFRKAITEHIKRVVDIRLANFHPVQMQILPDENIHQEEFDQIKEEALSFLL